MLLQAWIRAASAEGIATFALLAPAHADEDDWADAGIAVGDDAGGITWGATRAYASSPSPGGGRASLAARPCWPLRAQQGDQTA